MFDGDVGGEGPEVGVGDDARCDVFVGDGLEEAKGNSGEACDMSGKLKASRKREPCCPVKIKLTITRDVHR